MTDVKQVIVLRKDLNMRKGKMVAQGGHAILKTVMKQMHVLSNPTYTIYTLVVKTDSPQHLWFKEKFKKICVSCKDEDELFALFMQAKAAGLWCELIKDAGDTEFHGIPTYTALAIGPDLAEKINPITGHLPLL